MFLGVDGGGTKTALCVVSAEGQVLARTQVASSYYFTEGVALVRRVLGQGITAVCAAAGATPDQLSYAFFGLPSYGEVSADLAELDAAPREALGHDRYRCDNDMVCGWAGSLGAADGINVISGTGSMTYGERAGRGVRVGGWGELFGDEGSAYWIAMRGLGLFSRMADGRTTPGPLLDVLRDHLGLRTDLDLVDVVLNQWQGGRSEIAALSRQVVEAATLGDFAAARVLADAGRELAVLVDTTTRTLGFGPEEVVPVSYSGGAFSADGVRDAFTRALAELPGDHELRPPRHPPDIGAALYAAKLAGTPLDHVAQDRLCAATTTAVA